MLAIGANPEEFEAVLDLDKAIMAGQGGFDLPEDAVVEFNDAITLAAQQVMVVMAGGIIIGDFEPRQTISKVDAVDQAHLFEEGHATVDGGQVARSSADRFGNLLRRRGASQSQERLEEELTRAGDAARLSSNQLLPLRRR